MWNAGNSDDCRCRCTCYMGQLHARHCIRLSFKTNNSCTAASNAGLSWLLVKTDRSFLKIIDINNRFCHFGATLCCAYSDSKPRTAKLMPICLLFRIQQAAMVKINSNNVSRLVICFVLYPTSHDGSKNSLLRCRAAWNVGDGLKQPDTNVNTPAPPMYSLQHLKMSVILMTLS